MRDETRRYLSEDAALIERANKFLADGPEPTGDLGEVLLDARLDAAEATAGAPPLAEALWLVRLSGENIQDGWIDPDMQKKILGPLAQEVEAAAGKAASEAKIGLVGVSSGSVILHYRPRHATRLPTADQINYSASPADAAIARVSQLHDMLESEAPDAMISSAFRKDTDLLKHARQLIENLNDYNVNLSTRWWSSQGSRSVSRLTERGRDYGSALFARTARFQTEIIHGIVTGLDLDGEITIARASRGKWKVEADPEVVKSPRFALGEVAHLVVRQEQDIDRVGVKGKERFIFVDHYEGGSPFLQI